MKNCVPVRSRVTALTASVCSRRLIGRTGAMQCVSVVCSVEASARRNGRSAFLDAFVYWMVEAARRRRRA
jgi:hypothetical protein